MHAPVVGKTPDGKKVYGAYDAGRVKEVHKPYVDGEIAKSSGAVGDPTFHMLGGGAASGKSSILKTDKNPGGQVDTRGHVKADPDEAKKQIPEYQKGTSARDDYASAIAHEESSDMSKTLIHHSLSNGHNTLLDGVGDNSADSVRSKVKQARASGAKHVKADYVTVDTDEAIRRAAKRAKDPKSESYGRVVPEKQIRHGHEGVSKIFEEIAHDPSLFDSINLWDNNGKKPRLIASGGKGKLQIHDVGAYKKFLAKAK